jgi:hypothetical protein
MIMKPDPMNLQTLLDDLLPDASGLDRAALLTMVREEHARRRRRRILAAASGTAALILLPLLAWRPHRQESSPLIAAPVPPAPVMAPAPPAPSIVIQEVDDRQFLALLQDAPAALMEWPNGERTLLVMQR